MRYARALVGAAVVLAACIALALPNEGRSTAPVASRPGVEVVLRPTATISETQLGSAAQIMRARIARLGVHGTVSERAGPRLIVIRLSGVSLQAARVIAEPGSLELYDLTPSLLRPSIDASDNAVPTTSLYELLTRSSAAGGRASAFYLFDAKTKKLLAGPSPTVNQLRASAPAGSASRVTTALPLPAHTAVVSCDAADAVACPGLNTAPTPGVTYYYLLKHGLYPHDAGRYPPMTGSDVSREGARADTDPNSGVPIVTFEFTPKGDRLFHAITRSEATRGRATGLLQSFAVVLDGRIRSFPTIDYHFYPQGIDPTGTGVEITGLTSHTEASRLAAILQAGELPAAFEIASLRAVG